tara:strand:+ start:42 stop:329 length:288 start_codon:yes stop_codon:yes gene_type:complete
MKNTDFVDNSASEENSSTLQAKFWDFIKPTYHLQTTGWMRIIFLVRDFLLNFVVGVAILAILFLGPLSSYKMTHFFSEAALYFPLKHFLFLYCLF